MKYHLILLNRLNSWGLNHFGTLQSSFFGCNVISRRQFSPGAVSTIFTETRIIRSDGHDTFFVLIDWSILGTVIISKLSIKSYFTAEIQQIGWKLIIIIKIGRLQSIFLGLESYLLTLICILLSIFNNTFNIITPSIIKMIYRHISALFWPCCTCSSFNISHDFIGHLHWVAISLIEDFADATFSFKFLF